MADTTTNREAALLLSRVNDACEQCRDWGCPSFLGFLDDAQQATVAQGLRFCGLAYRFWGGYEDAERVYLGVFPKEAEVALAQYPLRCLSFRWRQEDVLSHRDFLGSLMALQLKREAVGDICVTPGLAHVFLSDHAAELVLRELTKIGRVGVVVSEQSSEGLRFTPSFVPVIGTAASLRLDCVIALLGNLSRSDAASLISSGLVSVGGTCVQSVSKQVEPGEKLSVRGVGKFIFDGQEGVSRRDRLRLKFRKYQ